METINKFSGEYDFLSNFYQSNVLYEGITYTTNEHAFQAAKSFDLTDRVNIAAKETPGKAKYAGRRVKLRPDWEEVKT